jgi:hypothetical protein
MHQQVIDYKNSIYHTQQQHQLKLALAARALPPPCWWYSCRDNKRLDSFFNIFSRVAHAGHLKPARLAALPASIVSAQAFSVSTGGASSPQQQQGQAAGDTAQAMQTAARMGVDIAPGIYSPTGIPPETWEELIVLPGDAAVNKHLWELGRKDALIWARATGLEAAAATKRSSFRMTPHG